MYYVYIIKSFNDKIANQYYVGYSTDLKKRLHSHNFGESIHTCKFKPWTLYCYFAFKEEILARKFEKYLKGGSGRAFSKKHFLLKQY